MTKLIRINKNGGTFLLQCAAPMDPTYVVETVDHIDVHFDLKSDRGEKELAAHGITRLKDGEVIVINL